MWHNLLRMRHLRFVWQAINALLNNYINLHSNWFPDCASGRLYKWCAENWRNFIMTSHLTDTQQSKRGHKMLISTWKTAGNDEKAILLCGTRSRTIHSVLLLVSRCHVSTALPMRQKTTVNGPEKKHTISALKSLCGSSKSCCTFKCVFCSSKLKDDGTEMKHVDVCVGICEFKVAQKAVCCL